MPKSMKTYQKLFAGILCCVMALAGFTACEWDNSPEPEHPLYVTYTITAGPIEYTGSDVLLQDINKWVKTNQKIYDVKVNYTTGEASEFTETDAKAIEVYEAFAPKFKAFLDECHTKLAKGEYEPDSQVDATFFIAATRTQGEAGGLKYEQVKLVYPTPNQ